MGKTSSRLVAKESSRCKEHNYPHCAYCDAQIRGMGYGAIDRTEKWWCRFCRGSAPICPCDGCERGRCVKPNIRHRHRLKDHDYYSHCGDRCHHGTCGH